MGSTYKSVISLHSSLIYWTSRNVILLAEYSVVNFMVGCQLNKVTPPKQRFNSGEEREAAIKINSANSRKLSVEIVLSSRISRVRPSLCETFGYNPTTPIVRSNVSPLATEEDHAIYRESRLYK